MQCDMIDVSIQGVGWKHKVLWTARPRFGQLSRILFPEVPSRCGAMLCLTQRGVARCICRQPVTDEAVMDNSAGILARCSHAGVALPCPDAMMTDKQCLPFCSLLLWHGAPTRTLTDSVILLAAHPKSCFDSSITVQSGT